MTAVTRWWWVRHAPVTGSEGEIYGQQDLACDCSDLDLFKQVAGMLPQNAVCLTSTLKRTQQTADGLVAGGLKFFMRLQEADFREQHFGDWQGVSYADFHRLRDGISHRYWLAPAMERPPSGESFVDLMARTAPAISKHSQAFADKDIIAVAHGGTIRAALAMATNCSAEAALAYSVENLSVTRLDYIQDENTAHWRPVFINWLPRRGRDG